MRQVGNILAHKGQLVFFSTLIFSFYLGIRDQNPAALVG